MKVKFKDGTKKDFTDLSDANMRGADLCGADLRYANLSYSDLRDANMRGADLCGANLRGADLRGANLRDANLRYANLDYSCWPLWCGSLSPKIDKRLACQLLYHTMRAMQGCDDSEVKEFLANNQAIALANQFDRADECGKILKQEVI